jgi:hypothetical protein
MNNFDDLLKFFKEWYRLLPTPGGALDEFNYIEKFTWFYFSHLSALPAHTRVATQDMPKWQTP